MAAGTSFRACAPCSCAAEGHVTAGPPSLAVPRMVEDVADVSSELILRILFQNLKEKRKRKEEEKRAKKASKIVSQLDVQQQSGEQSDDIPCPS